MKLKNFSEIKPDNVEAYIRTLAEQHGITAVKDSLSLLAEKISELSDAEVQMDDVKQMLINLARAKKIETQEAMQLLVLYLRHQKQCEN
jgi:hypothetical protein